jgi:hypothetical protein
MRDAGCAIREVVDYLLLISWKLDLPQSSAGVRPFGPFGRFRPFHRFLPLIVNHRPDAEYG